VDENVGTECRSWAHLWRPLRAWKIRGGFEEHRECAQCESVCIRLLDTRGYQVSRRIVYADGYLRRGMGRLSEDDRAELRLADIRQRAKWEQPST